MLLCIMIKNIFVLSLSFVHQCVNGIVLLQHEFLSHVDIIAFLLSWICAVCMCDVYIQFSWFFHDYEFYFFFWFIVFIQLMFCIAVLLMQFLLLFLILLNFMIFLKNIHFFLSFVYVHHIHCHDIQFSVFICLLLMWIYLLSESWSLILEYFHIMCHLFQWYFLT